jgi:hypothetical protein
MMNVKVKVSFCYLSKFDGAMLGRYEIKSSYCQCSTLNFKPSTLTIFLSPSTNHVLQYTSITAHRRNFKYVGNAMIQGIL